MLSSKTSKQKALLALAWVCFFWGTTWLASKEAVSHNMPALQVCAIRQLFGGTLYLLYFIITKHPWPKGKQWGTILMLSFLNFMLSNGLSTWGVQYISSGLGDHRCNFSIMVSHHCFVWRKETTTKRNIGIGTWVWWCVYYFLRSPERFFKCRFSFWYYDLGCCHHFMGYWIFIYKKARC